MFKHIQNFLKLLSDDASKKQQLIDFNTALAALLIEVMRADGQVLTSELKEISKLLKLHCELETKQVTQLMLLSESLVENAIDLHAFVTVINQQTTYKERIDIVQILWTVALADSKIDPDEDHVVRKISGLMHVAHVDFIAAKLSAQSK